MAVEHLQNPHAAWRLGLARQIAGRLSAFEGLRAIMVAGSVARGYADEYADLELPIVWDTLPDDAARHAVVATLNGRFLYAYDGPACEDQLLLNGFQVDLWHAAVADEEAVIDAVLHDHNPDLGHSNFMDTLRACIPLYGETLIQRWKQRAQEYPDGLRIRNVRDALSAFRTSELTLYARRNNPTSFYATLSHLQQQAFMVLLALNRHYFPTFKWLYQALASMPIKPLDVEQRWRTMFGLPAMQATAHMAQVLDEVLELVEQHVPQVDTSDARRRLSYTRAAWTGPVSVSFEKDL